MKKVKILALISAVVTGLLLFVFLNSLNKPVEIDKTKVIVAASDIPADTPITPEMITQKELPTESIVSGALSDSTMVIGKVTKGEIYTGEQLLSSELIQAGESTSDTLAYALEPGMRAITIGVDQTSGVAYMIVPGDHVDILSYFLRDDGISKSSYTTMILEDITVLAVDQSLTEQDAVSSDSGTYLTITLQVTPKQAMELSMAQSEGQLRAILRSPLDDQKTGLPSVRLEDIMVK